MRRFLLLAAGILAVSGFPLLAACSETDLLNATIPDSGYTVMRGIDYETDAAQEPRHKLDIYVPSGVSLTATKGVPVVFFIYGGDWRHGSRDDYKFAGEAFASQGFVTVIADYRLYPQVCYPAFLDDGEQALQWVHANIARYGGDPARVFVAGHSAGAYNALMLALAPQYESSRWLRGAIGLAGPYNFLPLDKDTGPVFGQERDLQTVLPVTYAAGGGHPPVLLLHGTDDDTVGIHNSRDLADALRRAGSTIEEKEYPGLGHIGLVLSLAHGFRDKAPVLADSVAFIRAQSR